MLSVRLDVKVVVN